MDIESLNNKQKEAVLDIGGPMLVFAGAGSGKTRVLTYKIAYLIQNVGLPPANILAVTFTNKAAQEMKSRVHDLVDVDISGITIGTFHSIGAMILRKEIWNLGWDANFTIYDQSDSKGLIKSVIKNLNFDLKMYDPRAMLSYVSMAKNNMQNPDDMLSFATNINEEKKIQIYSEYNSSLKKNNALDFDDLLIKPISIFNNHPNILEKYQEKFQYILVDEYQDTNKPQFEFINLLTTLNKDIFVVGDDDQSIYGWRGADINNILNFQNTYHDAKIVKLEENYRSTQNILDAAWSVVSRNKNRADKKLWTKNSEGDSINILKSYNERDEAIKIISDISKIKNDNDISYNKFLILYRTNAQSRVIEDALIKNGILYNIVGGVKFYDRKEVKDILAYMRFIVNPCDTISFDRIVNFPIRGIGKTTVEKIHAALSSDNIMESLAGFDKSAIGKKQSMALEEFYKMIQSYSKRSVEESPSGIIKDLLIDLKLKEFYMNQNTLDGEERWRNIEECISGIVDYEKNTDNPSLSGYLEEVSLFTDIDSWNDENDKITMMTIHSSKGLEFDYVYIAGLERGLFPIERAVEEGSIDEERRLFYVALTRAQKKVTLSYAKSRRRFGSEPIPSSKSPFITEIPSKLIDESIFKSQSKNRIYDNNITSDECLIKKNQIVYHKLFGKGKVENVEGSGINAKLTILFFNNTRKKLIYKYANLEVIK
tara:strand:- start:3674 stop:5803 length:2130 start_codon:yes stop_codon:yes gene_type:complete